MDSNSPTATKAMAEVASQAEPKTVQSKIFNWGSLHSGDCEQDGGQIVFHSDGTGTFTCTTLTYQTHTGDIWHASFSAKGSNGAVLFSTKTFNSPRMNDGNPPPRYHWAAQFSFLPEYWQGIASVTQHCSC